jgi:signal transduction histidine kinase
MMFRGRCSIKKDCGAEKSKVRRPALATILIVDDNPSNRDVIVTLLNYYNHRVLEAADGLDGLDAVREEKPDLIIADILMPTMNGFEFVSKLRQHPVTAQIPVIFYSATFHDAEMKSLSNACGVTRLLPKPAEPEQVLQLVNEALASPSPVEPQVSPALAGIEVVQILNNKLFEKNSELQELNAQLEKRISERTSELEHSNRMLQHQIEERERTESELRQVQRLDAIGRLAGGLAHDFNNLLAIILGQNARLLARSENWESTRMLESIKAAVERGMSLTSQLLAFARQQPLETKIVNFNTVLASVEKLLRVSFGENIELELQTDPGLGSIAANSSQLEQVVLNLAFNAKDAMPNGGKLTISTSNLQLEKADEKHSVVGSPGPYICVAVTDTGCGMDEETQSRIFEPYFTTKGLGKGTGLGLSTVYGIVKQSGGQILVYSEPGHGTTFNIYWPQTESVTESPRLSDGDREVSSTKTILVVEDETPQLEITCEVLQENGYVVLSAGSAEDAIHLASTYQGAIDLLITDVIMPKMNGKELSSRLCKDRSELKVLFVSGYSSDVLREGMQESIPGGFAFLQKPFTYQMLAQKIREMCGSQAVRSVGGKL